KVLYFSGLSYLKLAKYRQARSCFRKLISYYPHSKLIEEGWLRLADSYFLEGNLSRAKVIYKKLERNTSFNFLPTVYLRLAQVCAKEGKWQDKRRYLKKIKERFPLCVETKYVSVLENYGDYFTIQVGAFNKKKNALSLKKELSKRYPVYIIEEETLEYILYKVRVGKFKGRNKTKRVYRKLIKEGYSARIYP
ncbi:MAG TPA: tetratricopeptide repeat protein, partial [Candidatus Omnitrophica bacterium]|nr:tetratricopeptide repeat protein [Candidatus Omnitrophota bacterium]